MRQLSFRMATTIVALCAPILSESLRADDVPKANRAVLIEFNGPIHAISEQYLYRKLEAAKKENADLVIIEIDSPGGGVDETMRIAERLGKMDWARTVAYIPREAISGAALFSLACDEIIVAPDAKFGDAGPIFMDENFLFKHAPEKYISDLALRVRELAEMNNRPPALAEAMVDMTLIVYPVKNVETGETTFMSQQEIDSSPNPKAWEKGNPVFESREDHFLNVSGRRAVELQLAEATASGRADLKARYQLDSEMIVLNWNSIDTAVIILNHPIVTGILFVVGLIALYLEFASPGIGIGGMTALICFGVFFWSRFLGGTAEWLEVVLFAGGVLLIIVEVFVIPGFGIWGITGLLLLMSSLVLASEPFLFPKTQAQLTSMTRTFGVVLGSGVVFLVAAAAITSYLGKIPVLNRLALKPPVVDDVGSEDDQSQSEIDGVVVQIGDVGVAESPLRPAGRVRFGEEFVDVVSDGAFIDSGQQVRVVKVRANHIIVRQLG